MICLADVIYLPTYTEQGSLSPRKPKIVGNYNL